MATPSGKKWIARTDLTDGDKGWAAGTIDGEGCISIYGRPQRITKKGIRALQLVITVVNTDPRMPQRMKEYFGGWFGRSMGRQRGNRRPTFTWLITGRSAGGVLDMLLPFFVIKAEQATVALAYVDTIRNRGPISDNIRATRAILQQDLRLLKRVVHG